MRIDTQVISQLTTEDAETGRTFVALGVNGDSWFIVYERDDEDGGNMEQLGLIDKPEDFSEFVKTRLAEDQDE